MPNLLTLNDINVLICFILYYTQQLQNNISVTKNNMIIYWKHVFIFKNYFSPWGIDYKWYIEKLLCFKVTQNSSCLINVYATS